MSKAILTQPIGARDVAMLHHHGLDNLALIAAGAAVSRGEELPPDLVQGFFESLGAMAGKTKKAAREAMNKVKTAYKEAADEA